MAVPILACEGIVKGFPGVRALKGVDFAVLPGRVHGLVGENGAGKSTLLKVMAGVYRPDAGTLRLGGEPVRLAGTDDALRRGIVTVHQDINLIGSMTVAENVMLNNEPTRGGLLRGRALHARVAELLRTYGIDASPEARVADLPNDVKKMVQILKAVARDARVLLLDEPTSSLTDVEVGFVLRLVRTLAERRVGIVFVSHYLVEVFAACDDITVVRDGAVVASTPRADTDLDTVVQRMIGRSLDSEPVRPPVSPAAEVLFSVRDLGVRGSLEGVSFDLHGGEVLGVTGLTGSGLTELARALFGSEDVKRASGRFAIRGRAVRLADPPDSLNEGVALLTHDRLREGILPEAPLYENICLAVLHRFTRALGLLDERAMVETGRAGIARLKVRAPGPLATTKTLSGGNQQKVLFAKWLETKPAIFIMDEPTIGIDVGSKSDIRAIVAEIAAQGVGIILISTDLLDIERLCDRALVMFRGAVVGEFAGEAVRREPMLAACVSGRMP